MHRPECVFWERRSAKSILIANHYKFVVSMFAYKKKCTNSAFYKLQFLKRIYLLVGRFLDKRAVTVNH